MKVLNLYACLGGNRYKWDEVADIDVTAVELDPYAAELYAERFPNDTVIVADAHAYLLDNYQRFDFIWSSPPCPTHSGTNHFLNAKGIIRYPSMDLYQEIILLKSFYNGKFCVENVVPYYDPLIPAQKRGRHLYWTNFTLPAVLSQRHHRDLAKMTMKELANYHAYDFNRYKGSQRRDKMARNLVDYEAGKTIFQTACGIICKQDQRQLELL